MKLRMRSSILCAAFLAAAALAFPHCDSLDGPVVTDARKALEAGDPAIVLKWVMPAGEAEVKAAFAETLKVRKLGDDARVLADRAFFETLVRVHRAGEGFAYTGLKPAGRDLGPAIPAADQSIRDGKLPPVYKLLTDAVHEGLHHRYERLTALQPVDPKDVAKGRAWVEAYVDYIHYVEGIYQAAGGGAHTEGAEAKAGWGD